MAPSDVPGPGEDAGKTREWRYKTDIHWVLRRSQDCRVRRNVAHLKMCEQLIEGPGTPGEVQRQDVQPGFGKRRTLS